MSARFPRLVRFRFLWLARGYSRTRGFIGDAAVAAGVLRVLPWLMSWAIHLWKALCVVPHGAYRLVAGG